MYLSEYLLHYAKAECLKIGVMMLKLRKPFKETIMSIISKRQDSSDALKEWSKRCPPGIDKQFNELVLAVRTLEVKLQKMRQRSQQKSGGKKTLNGTKSSSGLNLSLQSVDSTNAKVQKKGKTMVIKRAGRSQQVVNSLGETLQNTNITPIRHRNSMQSLSNSNHSSQEQLQNLYPSAQTMPASQEGILADAMSTGRTHESGSSSNNASLFGNVRSKHMGSKKKSGRKTVTPKQDVGHHQSMRPM